MLYAARDLSTALAETVLRDRFYAVADRVIGRTELDRWVVTEIGAATLLRLVDLRGPGPFRLGLDSDIRGARNHAPGQILGGILSDEAAIDGLVYPSRITLEDSIAVYARSIAAGCLTASTAVPLPRLAALVPALAQLNVRLEDW